MKTLSVIFAAGLFFLQGSTEVETALFGFDDDDGQKVSLDGRSEQLLYMT